METSFSLVYPHFRPGRAGWAGHAHNASLLSPPPPPEKGWSERASERSLRACAEQEGRRGEGGAWRGRGLQLRGVVWRNPGLPRWRRPENSKPGLGVGDGRGASEHGQTAAAVGGGGGRRRESLVGPRGLLGRQARGGGGRSREAPPGRHSGGLEVRGAS